MKLRGVWAVLLLVVVLTPFSGCRFPAPRLTGTNRHGYEVDAARTGTGQVRAARRIPKAGKVKPPAYGAYLGVYCPPAPFQIDALDRFVDQQGREVAIAMWYQPWATDNRYLFDPGATVAVLRRGNVPMITWEPWSPGKNANLLRRPAGQPRFRLRRILSGEFDAYIRRWARDIRKIGGPIMLRPMHEMNGEWYPWGGTVNGNTPAEFRAAWRRIWQVFRQEKATNVTWVWSINHESVPATNRNSYAAYYPGDAYVDWTAISGFNWGTTSRWSSWRSFDHWYRAPLAYLRTVGKPVIIAEFASVEQGGSKGAWIADAYRKIRQHPEVKGIVYYDSKEASPVSTQDWRVNTSKQSLAAFRRAVSSPYYRAGAPKALVRWTDSLTEADKSYLLSLKTLY